MLIGVLGLVCLLQLAMHVTPLLVDGTDKILVVQLLEDGQSAVQVVLCSLLLEEFPILVTLDPQKYAVIEGILRLFIPIDYLLGFL